MYRHGRHREWPSGVPRGSFLSTIRARSASFTRRRPIQTQRPRGSLRAALRDRKGRNAYLTRDAAGLLFAARSSLMRAALPSRPRRKYSLAPRTLPLRLTSTESIAGLCAWNTRSTPVPCEILRTVKAECRPRLRRAITTPSNACTRSRLPSFTLTLTTTVSPAANGGSSRPICVDSNCSMILFMGVTLVFLFEFFQQALVAFVQRQIFQQLRAPQPGPAQRLHPAPAADGRVVA